jgi:DNA-binding transcriptional regulator YdaS (Cro superfamily)
MELKKYLKLKRGNAAQLARDIGSYPPDISDYAKGKKPIPFPFGPAIEEATGGLVTRKDLFPDTWAKNWPELVEKPEAKKAA